MSDSERSDAIGVLRAMATQAAHTATTTDEMYQAELRVAGAALDLAKGDRLIAKELLMEAYNSMERGRN